MATLPPLPKLNVPEPGPNAMQQFSQLLQAKGQMQQQQMGQIQMQQAQQQQKDQQALGQLMIKHRGNIDKVIQDAPDAGVMPNTVLQLQQHALDVKTKLQTYDSEALKNLATRNDNARGLIQPIVDAKPEDQPALYAQARQTALQNPQAYGITDPNQIPEQFPGPDALKTQIALHQGGAAQAAQAIKEREVAAQEMTAQGRQMQGQAALAKQAPLAPPVISQKQQQLQDRYQVLNPGKPLPQEFTLAPNATRQDYEDMDKAMEQVEKATSAKASVDAAATARNAAAQDRAEKVGMKPVIGFDPKSGQQIFAAQSEAKQLGLKSIREVGQAEAEKVTNARSLMPLLDSSDPSDPGVLQMAKKLDAEGKLGPIASRWNEFMTGKVGAGDPEVAAFRAKMGLSTTALMQVHVGSRGGAFMLEHFEDLANAKKMDGPTLISALDTENKYVQRKAMMPKSGNQQPQQAAPQTTPSGSFNWNDHPIVK